MHTYITVIKYRGLGEFNRANNNVNVTAVHVCAILSIVILHVGIYIREQNVCYMRLPVDELSGVINIRCIRE